MLPTATWILLGFFPAGKICCRKQPGSCLDVSRQIIHDANLYLAMIGVLNNTVIKPGQGYPNETLAKESKKCAKSLHTKYGLWLPRDDGKETVSEDYYFSSRQ